MAIGRALAAGLTFRPLETTIRDTLDWWKTLPEERRAAMKAGLPGEMEAAALAALAAMGEPGRKVESESEGLLNSSAHVRSGRRLSIGLDAACSAGGSSSR